VAGCEILSASGSTRLWAQPVHEALTIAAVHRADPQTATEWRTRGRTVTTVGGGLMSINAGDGHATLRVHAPAAFDAVTLDHGRIDDAVQAAGLGGAFRFRSPAGRGHRVFDAVRALVGAVASGEAPLFTDVACHELASAIVAELGEVLPSAPDGSRGAADRRLERARECLHDVESPPTVAAIADHAGLGKSQLCALFKHYYGVSMGRYGLNVRIARAKTMLLRGAAAKDVAAELGFTDQAHLSRHFRRHYGLAPGQWVVLYGRNSGPQAPRRRSVGPDPRRPPAEGACGA
jgi:AraC-like DNA-binding protein